MEIKKEADELLNKATNGIKQLESKLRKHLLLVLLHFQMCECLLSLVTGLEKKFKSNERRMQMQRAELDELMGNATLARDGIREQLQKYSNCEWGRVGFLYSL